MVKKQRSRIGQYKMQTADCILQSGYPKMDSTFISFFLFLISVEHPRHFYMTYMGVPLPGCQSCEEVDGRWTRKGDCVTPGQVKNYKIYLVLGSIRWSVCFGLSLHTCYTAVCSLHFILTGGRIASLNHVYLMDQNMIINRLI